MADRLSDIDLYEGLTKRGELRDAILDPVTSGETFVNEVALGGAGAIRNISNLLGNVPDVLLEGRDSAAFKNTKKVLEDRTKGDADRILDLLKVPFQDTAYSPTDAILGEGVTTGLYESIEKDKQALLKKQELGKQFSGGGFGTVAAEMFMATPIMRAGSMRSTSKALELGLSKVDTAKAVTVDALRNAGIFGTTEFGLAKLYGKTDEEATGNALAAAALGLVGSPLVGAGKGIARSLGAEERALRADFEAGGSRAGGGKPPEMDDPDLAFQEPKTPMTEAQKSKTIVEDVEYDVVSPKEIDGEPLTGQTFVPTVSNPKKYTYKFGVNGRVYNEQAHLLAPQGTAEQKASLKIRQKGLVENAEAEVNRRLEFYDKDQALRSAYGQTQTKFKGKKELSTTESMAKRTSFEKAQYRNILKDDNVAREVKLEARKKLEDIRDVNVVKETAAQLKRGTEKFLKQRKLKEPSGLKERDIDLNAEHEAYVKSLGNKGGKDQRGTFDLGTTKGRRELLGGVTKTMDKEKAIKAIDNLEIQEKLRAKDFDYKNITDEQRKLYRDEIAEIEDYFHTVSDINAFKKGNLTPEQFRFRAKRRLDEQLAKGEDGKPLTKEEAEEVITSNVKAYEEIGIHVEKPELKVTDDSVQAPKKGKGKTKPKEEPDRTADIEKAKKIHEDLVSTIKKFRDTGLNPRRTSKAGDKGGQLKLSKNIVDDIKDGILSDVEIANKTAPNVLNEGRKEAIEAARALANRKVSVTKAKELGIKKPVGLPQNILFKDTVVDASNSVMQVATVLLGNSNLAKLSKLFGGKTDVRTVIGEELTKKLGYKVDKDMVKPVFMTKNYGQGDKGLVNNLMKDNKWDRRKATEFLEAYYKAEGDLIPELKQLQDLVQSRIKVGKASEVEWTLPDGLVVKLNFAKELDGTYSIKGKDIPISIKSASIDEMSRALMPNIIHSVDAYVARRMNAKGIPTVHDAFTIPKGMEKMADAEYTKIMQEINDSSLLDDILKNIGVDSKSLPKRDLPSSKIAESESKLGVEHTAGKAEEVQPRTMDVSKSNTTEEVMRDYMASSNVRQLSTPQLIDGLVNESSYRTMSVAKETDDVFERQIALAHQSATYNPKMEIDVPDGVNKEVWNRVQRDIFNEARSKLEYNPLLRDTLQGNRKYFNKQGKIVGDDKQSLQQFIQREIRNDRKLDKLRNADEKEALKTVGKDYESVKKKVDSWSTEKNLNEDQLSAKKTVNEASGAEPEPMHRETLDGVKKYFTDQYKSTVESKAFRRLSNIRKTRDREVQYEAEKVYIELDRLMKASKTKSKDWTKHILNTDFHSIRHMDKDVAMDYAKEFDSVYQRAKPYIDQHVKALNDKSQQTGYYLNNARQIADAVGLDASHAPIIDRLISVKAMTDDGWKFVDENRGSELWDMSMNIMKENRVKSAENFASNPQGFVKGFTKEYYGSGKQLVGRKVMWDAEDKAAQGLIPMEAEAKKVGKVTDKTKVPYSKFKSREELLDYAAANDLKVTDKGFRQIENADLRNQAGRSDDFTRILSETSHSIDQKMADRMTSTDILKELDAEDSLISTKPKDNFREITMDERNAMPHSLQGKVRYVHKDYIDRIVGRRETRLVQKGRDVAGANQRWKIADRLLGDFVANFKQNVVLKNISSFKNAILVNQTIATMAGVTPTKSYRLHKEAMNQIKRNDNLRSKIALLKVQGKPYKHIQKRLEQSDLYQMEQLGLSLNQLDGVRGDSSLLAHMLSDFTGNRFDKIANEVLLNQKGKAGKFTTSVFSTIDTQGRYTVTKQFIEDGFTMQEAVNKANGLFGDMDEMAPVLVEAMDKYGAIPFLKWYTLTSPQLMKLAKDNPKKTAMLSVALYAMSAETDMNFSTVNPIEAMVDFADNAMSLDYLEAVTKKGFVNPTIRKLTPYVVPNAWQDIDRVFTDVGEEYTLRPGTKRKAYNPLVKDRIGAPWSEDSLDYRGFTQKVIQGTK